MTKNTCAVMCTLNITRREKRLELGEILRDAGSTALNSIADSSMLDLSENFSATYLGVQGTVDSAIFFTPSEIRISTTLSISDGKGIVK